VTINKLNLKSRDFELRDLTKRIFDMPEKPLKLYPKWVDGQLCKDVEEENKVLEGGKSDAIPAMTKPKPAKRKNGRKI